MAGRNALDLKALVQQQREQFEEDKRSRGRREPRLRLDDRFANPHVRRTPRASAAAREDDSEWVRVHAGLVRKQQEYERLAAQRGESDDGRTGADELMVDFSGKSAADSDPEQVLTTREIVEHLRRMPAERASTLVEVVDEFGRSRWMEPREAQSYEDAQRLERYEQEEKTVHFDSSKEVRDMGAGFYQFSQNEAERAAQMADLRRIRTETLAAQHGAHIDATRARVTKILALRQRLGVSAAPQWL